MQPEATIQDVLTAVNTFATHVESRFDESKQELARVESKMVTKDELKEELSRIESKMVTKGELKQELGKLQVKMVSKDYLDDKFSDLRGDLTVQFRKEDTKIIKIVNLLEQKHIFTQSESQSVKEAI